MDTRYHQVFLEGALVTLSDPACHHSLVGRPACTPRQDQMVRKQLALFSCS